jgi:hypothetical protein
VSFVNASCVSSRPTVKVSTAEKMPPRWRYTQPDAPVGCRNG